MELRFDHGPDGTATLFAQPLRVIRASDAAELPAAFKAMTEARKQGMWLAGYASYEMGYALEPCLNDLMPQKRRIPLLAFGVFEAPIEAKPLGKQLGELTNFAPDWDEARYAKAFDYVHQSIGAGDIYQANLTFPLRAQATGTPKEIFAALSAHQDVGYGVLIEEQGLPAILSRSPEMFFRSDSEGNISTRPMKGTAPRGATHVQDLAQIEFLKSDEKTLAENLMIVDLLRNDLSRIAEPGSVKVPELFTVETYDTVHQMVSHITAKLRPEIGLPEIFKALFPCGSITGAPKIRAMEIIRALEPDPREIYCGTIGWAAPDGRAEFNVAIRTLVIENGEATLNVGGGLVWDSRAAAEYEEALWKTRFAQIAQMTSA